MYSRRNLFSLALKALLGPKSFLENVCPASRRPPPHHGRSLVELQCVTCSLPAQRITQLLCRNPHIGVVPPSFLLLPSSGLCTLRVSTVARTRSVCICRQHTGIHPLKSSWLFISLLWHSRDTFPPSSGASTPALWVLTPQRVHFLKQ